MNLFHDGNYEYQACAERLTGRLILYHLSHKQANALRLFSICRDTFQTYGAPEELSCDSGPPFTSLPFKQFLEDWAIICCFPMLSNGQAEFAVKTTKRIVNGNIGAQGSLDNDLVARVILQYRTSGYLLCNYDSIDG